MPTGDRDCPPRNSCDSQGRIRPVDLPPHPRGLSQLPRTQKSLAAGLAILAGAGFMENTLLRLVQKQHPNADPVHRLGRGTSGIILFAKPPQAAATLSAHWNTPKIEKLYRVLAQHRAPR